jgi:hypothetical protein
MLARNSIAYNFRQSVSRNMQFGACLSLLREISVIRKGWCYPILTEEPSSFFLFFFLFVPFYIESYIKSQIQKLPFLVC